MSEEAEFGMHAYYDACNGEQVRRAAMNEKQRFTIGDGITNVAIY